MSSGMNSLDELYSYLAGPDGAYLKKNNPGGTPTHCTVSGHRQAYVLPDKKHNGLYRRVAKAVADGYVPHITERYREIGPVVVDLDFVYPEGESKRQYTPKMILDVVQIYMDAVEELLEVSDEHLLVHVYEKAEPNFRGGRFHDGIHMVFPYIRCKPEWQLMVRNRVVSIMEEMGTLDKISDNPGAVIDKAVINQSGWMIYGCSKGPDASPYHITSSWTFEEGRLQNILDYKPRNARDIYQIILQSSIRASSHHAPVELRPTAEIPLGDMTAKEHKRMLKTCISEANTKAKYDNILKTKPQKDTLEEVEELMPLVRQSRSVGYSEWVQVGLCLKSIDPGLTETWLKFSAQCPDKYDRDECLKVWAKFKPSCNRMNTLHWLARNDSPDRYAAMMQQTLENMDLPNFSVTHQTIAKILYEKFRFRFKCSSIEKKIWYEFRDHRWQLMDCADTLFLKIDSDVVPHFEEVRAQLIRDSINMKGMQKQLADKQAAVLEKKIEQLGDVGFREKVIRACSYMFKDRDFDRLRDEDHKLLGCANGVYDFRTGQFRDGFPDDNITMNTGVDYKPYDPNDKYVRQVLRFIETIQTDEVNSEYILSLLSTCLVGSVADESLYILTGIGSNGKSKLMELVGKTLGDYYKKLDIVFLTGRKTNSSNASPEMADKKGIRMCVMDEPNKGDKMNIGLMKNLTGGDEVTARALYGNQIYFKPQFKLFMVCNDIPELEESGADFSIWRRLKAILFDSVFFKSKAEMRQRGVKELGEKQFMADTKLSDRFEKWKTAFLSILVHYQSQVERYGLHHPDSVIQHTLEYQRECDKYAQFFDDSLTNTDNKEDKIPVMKLISYFKQWNSGVNGRARAPTKKEMTSYLNTQMSHRFKSKDGFLWGYRYKEEDLTDILG